MVPNITTTRPIKGKSVITQHHRVVFAYVQGVLEDIFTADLENIIYSWYIEYIYS